MARLARKATIGTVAPALGTPNDPNAAITTLAAAMAAAVALAPATATVAADVATLVADGATPTQAHVNTLNTDWGTFLTAFNTYAAAVAALDTTAAAATVSSDVTLLVNTSTVTTKNKLTEAVMALLSALRDGTNAFPD